MPPTPLAITSTFTSSFDNLIKASAIASTEPCISAFRTTFNTFTSAAVMFSKIPSNDVFWRRANFTSRNFPCRNNATSRALFSSGTTIASSPACGIADKPNTSTGIEGPALSTKEPLSLTNARTRPYWKPAKIISPLRKVPRCTRMVATGPRPLSNRDSITTPLAAPSV